MRAFSQNGYPAGVTSKIRTYTVPGTRVRLPLLAGDTATVLVYFAARWHREVEPLGEGCWGYALRLIRGASAVSNHGSGTAIDLSAPRHPLGADPRRSLSRAQINAIHTILADCGGVLRWGGDYRGRKDSMHTEVVGSPADVARVAARLRAGVATPVRRRLLPRLTRRPAAARPARGLHRRQPIPKWWGSHSLRVGSTGGAVVGLQKRLNAYGAGLAVDGQYGPRVKARVQLTQQRHGLPATGVVDEATARAIGG